MNQARTKARDKAVCAAISAVASQLKPLGDSSWRFTLLNGAPHVVTARINDDWLMLEAECEGEAQPRGLFWDALVRNSSLECLAKVVLAQDVGLRLRAELPILEDVDLGTRVGEACRGFEAEWTHTGNHSYQKVSSNDEESRIDLKGLCTEAGWPFAERSGGKLAVELEVPDGFCHALLIPAKQGVHIHCEIATLEDATAECRQAVAAFLLAASGLIRMGRASIKKSDGAAPVAQFEVVFGTAPSPLEISSALECLSVACSICGEEIKTLQVPAIAERYLALRGRGDNPEIRPTERTVTP